ncbi:multiheme c-type cytochrome [Vibrio neptunius]|uniref:multiheme c-type cytochrome n=1 Tax=Vibrio neptunius TaxID=170651 RepID=UPI003314946D
MNTSLAKTLSIITLYIIAAIFSSAHASQFVGSNACADCHQEAFQAWQGSHHQQAMQHATAKTVLGDFNDTKFEFEGSVNRFFTLNDQFLVNIQGPDGQWHDYQIKYTFGVTPLQQYMVEFEDGRVQLIPFAWDSRPENQGGQRWFHLYPNMTPKDEFYWTNTGQNWNFMCADCHSTNLEKNYSADTNTYKTTWSEISVGCEACHGAGQAHLDWANSNQPSQAHFGFDRDLSKAVKEWVIKEGSSTAQPLAIEDTDQMAVCAQCHSRRVQLSESNDHVSGNFLDRYLLSTITPELYHHDGQIHDENYVYGSFLQSKMAEKGVSCTNCHDPHNATLKIPEETVCAQCHSPQEYGSDKHTFHLPNSEASKCTTCHMPETTYMQVDPRRDHSWQIPRPDLSMNIGTPNVCTSCHEDKTDQWANSALEKWFPNSEHRNPRHFSIAFYASAINHNSAGNALSYVAQNSGESAIIRASALQRIANHLGQNSLVALARATKHQNELIRLGAVQGAINYPFDQKWQLLAPLLEDSVYAVRTEAAGALAKHWQSMTITQKQRIEPALEEYVSIQIYNSDRGFGRTNLGNVYRAKGKLDKAITSYTSAIEIEPYYPNSHINLADLYKSAGKEELALNVLKQGLNAQPSSGVFMYSIGLSLIRQKNKSGAISYFKQATIAEPENAQYWLVYGLSLEQSSLTQADSSLAKAYNLSQDPNHLYARCDLQVRHKLKTAQACINKLAPFAPDDVISQLKAKLHSPSNVVK